MLLDWSEIDCKLLSSGDVVQNLKIGMFAREVRARSLTTNTDLPLVSGHSLHRKGVTRKEGIRKMRKDHTPIILAIG